MPVRKVIVEQSDRYVSKTRVPVTNFLTNRELRINLGRMPGGQFATADAVTVRIGHDRGRHTEGRGAVNIDLVMRRNFKAGHELRQRLCNTLPGCVSYPRHVVGLRTCDHDFLEPGRECQPVMECLVRIVDEQRIGLLDEVNVICPQHTAIGGQDGVVAPHAWHTAICVNSLIALRLGLVKIGIPCTAGNRIVPTRPGQGCVNTRICQRVGINRVRDNRVICTRHLEWPCRVGAQKAVVPIKRGAAVIIPPRVGKIWCNIQRKPVVKLHVDRRTQNELLHPVFIILVVIPGGRNQKVYRYS